MYNWHNVFQPIYQIDQNMNPRIDHYEMLLHDENDKFPAHDFFSAISTSVLRKTIKNGFKQKQNLLKNFFQCTPTSTSV